MIFSYIHIPIKYCCIYENHHTLFFPKYKKNSLQIIKGFYPYHPCYLRSIKTDSR